MAMADPSERPGDGAGWHEIVATALLVLTAVATSWSSYQATRWHGEQAATANRTSALRIEGASAAALGEAETQIDVATFIAWVDADRRRTSRSPTSTSPASVPSSGPPSTPGRPPTR